MKTNRKLRRAYLEKHFKISTATAKRDFGVLEDQVEFTGTGASGYYVLRSRCLGSSMPSYRDGGTGTFTGAVHFPLAVLLPMSRPEASRWVVELPLVLVVPANRPEASRY